MGFGFDLQAIGLLASDPTAKKLLDIIAQNRAIRFSALLNASQVDHGAATEALKKLTDHRLVESSAIDATKAVDFDSYYVTANGLELNRRVGGK